MKKWTLADANRSLPLVKRIVRDIVDQYRELESLREVAEAKKRQGRPAEAREVLETLQAKAPALETLVNELTEIGVELKDFRMGLIDFRADLDGREVLLCWKLGEDKIEFWHDLTAGFAGRTPVAGYFTEA
jgi:hypothetical protein